MALEYLRPPSPRISGGVIYHDVGWRSGTIAVFGKQDQARDIAITNKGLDAVVKVHFG